MTKYAMRARQQKVRARIDARAAYAQDQQDNERAEFEATFGARLNRTVVPRDIIELCFDAWKAGRRELAAASGAPVEIQLMDVDE